MPRTKSQTPPETQEQPQEHQPQPPKTRRRKRNHEPVAETELVIEDAQEVMPSNKYAKTRRVGTPTLGRSPNYVETVGLGNLKVETANGYTDV